MFHSRRHWRPVGRPTAIRWLRCVFAMLVAALLLLASALDASAAVRVLAAPADLGQVIDHLRNWLIGFLVGLATLFLTIGGIRYLAADGDPGETERAKKGLRNAVIGYAVAILAPLIVAALKSIVGAP